MTHSNEFTKYAAESKYDCSFEWELLAGETIESHLITVDEGITKVADSLTGNVVTVRLAGGTEGKSYKITCQIFTTGARDRDPIQAIYVIVV